MERRGPTRATTWDGALARSSRPTNESTDTTHQPSLADSLHPPPAKPPTSEAGTKNAYTTSYKYIVYPGCPTLAEPAQRDILLTQFR